MGKPVRARVVLQQIVLLPMAVAALLVLALVFAQYRQDVADARTGAMGTARALAVAVDHRIREAQAGLSVLAAAGSLARGEFEAFHERASALHGQLGVSNIVLLDENGDQLVNTLRAWGSALPSQGESAPALPVIRSGLPMARVVPSPFLGRPVAVVSVPVYVEGRVRYALSGVVAFERFQSLLAGQGLPESWIAAIVDSAGIIVARSVQSDKFVGKPAAQVFREALVSGHSGIFDGRTLEGIDVLTAFSKGQSGWAVGIGIPQSELTRELTRSLWWLAGGVTLVLGLSTALAWTQGRRAEGSLARLVEAAERLGRGEPVDLPPMHLHEADQLAKALGEAGRKLAARHAELARNEARWSAVLDSATDGILSVGEDRRILVYNRAAERIFGWSAAEMVGQPVRKLLPPRLRAVPRQDLLEPEGPGGTPGVYVGNRLLRGQRKSGEEFPIEASISQVSSGGGPLFTVIVRDATERERAREQLARLARQANAAREQEKARIARELHDELAQTLSTLKIEARWLAGRLGSDSLAQAKVAEMASMLDVGVAATRRIAADLRPMILDDLGLEAALRWLAANFTRRTDVPCALDLRGASGLGEPHATAVFRIVQEALQNVAKHAQASSVEVSVARAAGSVVVRVEDDGVGFGNGDGDGDGDARRPESLGLVGLLERAQMLGGTLSIDSAPGRGTRVCAVLPIESAAPPPGAMLQSFPGHSMQPRQP